MTRGVTLIELVVTLAITGIVTAVAVPALGRAVADDPSPAAALTELLDRARRSAAERATVVTVVLAPESGAYRVWTESRGARTVLAEGVLALTGGGRFEATRPRLRFTFDPYGNATGDSVIVRGPDATLLVALDRWMGAVRVDRR